MTKLAEKLAGRFIVIDGPDGSGKSTQLKLLAEHLRGRGVSVCMAHDPGGTAIGERIRAILLDKTHTEMTVQCELMLCMASRSQLAAEVIRPALSRGQCVLCDRYISASAAYQGAGGIDAEDVLAAGRIAVAQTWPDLTIILDIPAAVGLTRAGKTGQADRMEAKADEFHRRVRRLFLAQAERRPETFALVDGSGHVEQVQQRLRDTIDNRQFKDKPGHSG